MFPGSFDPLTVAHLAVADAVRNQLGVDRVDLVVSRVALAKEHRTTPVDERIEAIRAHRGERPWLDAFATDAQLLADIAEGYDVVVMGADKWRQLREVRFYGGSASARDAALARLPRVALAPRAGAVLPPPDDDVHVLRLPERHRQVSSTAVRQGRDDWRARATGGPRRPGAR